MKQYYQYGMLLISFIFSACTQTIKKAEQIDLNGTWQFKELEKEGWTKAKVPGVVQLDLLTAGLIDDPFYGINEKKTTWVELTDWEYQRDFELSPSILEQDKVDLVFEGLDTYAEVYVNDQKLLQSDNMFCNWRIQCKDQLKVGKNNLRVIFRSPIKEKEAAYNNLGYQLPAGNDAGQLKVSPFVRKAPYHFGWDWGPRIVTMGIWRPVYLEAYTFAKVHDVYFEQEEVNKEKAKINTQIEVEYFDKKEEKVQITIKNNDEILHRTEAIASLGKKNYQLDFTIKQPKLWWCNGLGEAHLYNLTVELKRGGTIFYTTSKKIGLRKIELVQESDSIGSSYYFKLNGLPVFMKGANYIPQDNLLPRVTKQAYNQTIQNAVDANMNMLRVWGGGIYEDDYFYERCSEKGLLVWQDFMFACGMYPSDDEFLKNVQKEVQQNVRRLRNHACIALWCGNNEMEVAWNNWGWQTQFGYSAEDSATIIQGYQKIFHQLIPKELTKLNTHRPYVSTSPLSNWGTPENFNHQSMHYWGVWHGREPFENYATNVGRFMSEYGFQSFPTMQTIKTFADSNQWDLNSDVMQHHQKSYIGNGMIEKHLTTYYPKPKSFSDFVYLSQLTQAQGMSTAIESHRQSKGHCMGSLYWQINDCWPGPSWSSIDYNGKWKALHYKVRDLYQPILISAKENNDQLQVDLVSDQPKMIEGDLFIDLLTFDGQIIPVVQETKIQLPSGQKGLSFSYNTSTLLGKYKRNNTFLQLRFEGKKINSNQLYYFEIPKNLALQKATPITQLKKVEKGYELTLKSSTLIKGLFVAVEVTGNWSDNYFDLLPNQPKTIYLKTNRKINAKAIQYLSVNNLLN